VKYINERILSELGIDWPALLSVVEDVTGLIAEKDIRQPLKPYLRFKDPVNRIIAMPAYVGGRYDSAGIKWIASFPGNSSRSLKRAHSVIVLNDSDTGVPTTLINGAAISGIRTAAVSGFVLGRYIAANELPEVKAGIIGFGPIGQYHLQMLQACFGDRLKAVSLFDLRGIGEKETRDRYPGVAISICSSWEAVFEQSNVLITCTVARERYIDKVPKKGAVYLNVSLRDFKTDFLKSTDLVSVDDWEEVNRENTDIERAALTYGLSREDVLEITDLLDASSLADMSGRSFMFNPMGMAVYDIAVARYYQELALRRNNLIELED